jgi:hypothetical protein
MQSSEHPIVYDAPYSVYVRAVRLAQQVGWLRSYFRFFDDFLYSR